MDSHLKKPPLLFFFGLFFFLDIFVFLFSCTQDMKIMKKTPKIKEPTYSSKGFALIQFSISSIG